MDPQSAAGAALIGAMAGGHWQVVRAELVAFWRRAGGEQADLVGADLAELRAEVLAARQAGDGDTERVLADVWQRRIGRLLTDQPSLAGPLRRVLDGHLLPDRSPDERAGTGQSSDGDTR